jgi:hypothetical protein
MGRTSLASKSDWRRRPSRALGESIAIGAGNSVQEGTMALESAFIFLKDTQHASHEQNEK